MLVLPQGLGLRENQAVKGSSVPKLFITVWAALTHAESQLESSGENRERDSSKKHKHSNTMRQ